MTPNRIRRLRKSLKLTQAELADRIGAQRATIARWEGGKNQPRGANLKALLEIEKTMKK